MALAAEVDVSKLPPPAAATIDFKRDVRPIFEASCLRCHGPERPRGRFRLDNRESALKGGENNSNDIIPGDSARSPLIHYVARLVEGMEMPPAGKVEPLTPEQVGILRAWVDQGAKWDDTVQYPQATYAFTPAFRWIGVDGDRGKFREIEGLSPGWGGGVDYFSLEQRDGPDRRFVTEGRFLFPDKDYRLKVSWTKADVMFVAGGFERWRRFYDDTGGYYPLFTPPSFDLGRELYLDIGRVWMDFGLTLPDWPRVVLGYEFQFKDGSKSMLEWGNVNGKNIYPAAKAIDEETHVLKLDLTHDAGGWRLEDNARVEISRNDIRDRQLAFYGGSPALNTFYLTRQNFNDVQGANVFRAEKEFADWWFASGGYLYSRFDSDSTLNQSTLDAAGAPIAGLYWRDQVTLKRQTHAFSLANLFRPLEGLNLSLAVQSEFSRQEGIGNTHLDAGDPNVPGGFFLQPAAVRSDLDRTRISEDVGVRYANLPFTVLFAEGRFTQDRITQFEESGDSPGDAPFLFMRRDTDYANNLADVRAGFSTSPWRRVAINAHYRRRDSDSDYDHLRDESFFGGAGYSAFIRHRDIVTDEVEAKLVVHPVSWLKTTLTWQWTESDFTTVTDPLLDDPFFGDVTPGGEIFAGNSRAHVFGLSASFTPTPRLYLAGSFTYSDSRTITAAAGEIPGVVVPYEGDVYTAMANANFALNPVTRLQASWSFSRSDFGQNNVASLPLGLDYTRHVVSVGITRQITPWLTSDLRYSFYHYGERNTGGFNDFTAHGIFATFAFKWM